MGHSDETWKRWKEIEWTETAYVRWEAYFCSLIDEPAKAEALCALGIKVVRNEAILSPSIRSSTWAAFFGCLIGHAEHVEALCALGMKIVGGEGHPGSLRAAFEAIVRPGAARSRCGNAQCNAD